MRELLITLAVMTMPLFVFADGSTTRPSPKHYYATSRTPGAGCSTGPIVNLVNSTHTAWDHPYVDAEAAASIDNLRYGNLDALSPWGYTGGLGLGWLWSGSFGFGYNVGYEGLPR